MPADAGSPPAIAVADLDGDGDIDLPTAGTAATSLLWRNDGGNRATRRCACSSTGASATARRRRRRSRCAPAACARDRNVGGDAGGRARRPRLRPRRARRGRRRARAVAVRHPAGRDAAVAAARLPPPRDDRGARSQAVVVSVPLHLERRALRVRHRLHGRRRDGLLGRRRAAYNTPDPVEYVRIRGDQLQPRDGRYELRVTNELEETLFVDRLQLRGDRPSARTSRSFPNEG